MPTDYLLSALTTTLTSYLLYILPYKRERWYWGLSTIAPVVKNRLSTIRSLSDSTEDVFK